MGWEGESVAQRPTKSLCGEGAVANPPQLELRSRRAEGAFLADELVSCGWKAIIADDVRLVPGLDSETRDMSRCFSQLVNFDYRQLLLDLRDQDPATSTAAVRSSSPLGCRLPKLHASHHDRLCNKHSRLCHTSGRVCHTNGRLCNTSGRLQLLCFHKDSWFTKS